MVVLCKFPSKDSKSIISHSIWLNRIVLTGRSKFFRKFSFKIYFLNFFPYFFHRYKEAAVPPALWLEQSLNKFRESLLDLCQPNRAPTHAPLERSSPQHASTTLPNSDSNSNMSNSTSAAQAASVKQILDNLSKLMTSCVVLRIENFTLHRVTTAGKKQIRKEFISGKHFL